MSTISPRSSRDSHAHATAPRRADRRRLPIQVLCVMLLLQGSLVIAAQDGGDGSSKKPTKPPAMPKTKVEAPTIPPFDPSTLESVSPPLEAVTLVPGWNFVSIPEQPDDTSAASVLAPIAGKYFKVWAVDNCDTVDPWKLYQPSDLASSDLETIDPTKGMWIKALEVVDLPSTGVLASSTKIHLCPGWNLIGFPAAQIRPMPEAMKPFEGSYRRVMTYDATATESQWDVYSTDVPEWGNDLWEMKPGRAYWVLATEEATGEILNEGPPPEVELLTPDDMAVVTAPAEVLGAVRSPFLDHWTLRFRPAGEEAWTDFAIGNRTTDVTKLADFDPTLLLNGLYEIQLTAVDWAGQIAESEIRSVLVEGGMKIGPVLLPLLDLTIPVLGAPLEIVRTYDSRVRDRVGDFGYGWSLSWSQFEVRETEPPGSGWRGTVSSGVIPVYCIEPTTPHLVVVTFPDGGVSRFRPVVEPSCQGVSPPEVVSLRYEPLPGTFSRLAPADLSAENLLVVGSFPGPINLVGLDASDLHDPSAYRVKIADGTSVVLEEKIGLRSLTDLNGNTLRVTADGLEHSSGLGIKIHRDKEGRILAIEDPAGGAMRYIYGTSGNLEMVMDREEQAWRFHYTDGHLLTTVLDPKGNKIAAFEYDGENRWKGGCDADGRCRTFVHDLDAHRETLRDSIGNETQVFYDEAGNIERIVDGLGYETRIEYDDFDLPKRRIDPDGGVTEFIRDDFGRLIQRIDPHPADEPAEHFTRVFTRDAAGRVTRVDFPTGAALVQTFDAAGNLLRQEDEAGNLLFASTYGPGGVVTSETTPFGTVRFEDFTPHGKPRREIDEFGVVTTYSFDANGNPRTMEDPFFDAAWTYDALGRETRAQLSTGTDLRQIYGFGPFPIAFESPALGRQERLTSAAGTLKGWRLPGGAETRFSHDAAGRLIGQKGPGGAEIRLEYDAAGRVHKRISARGGVETLERDPMGRAVKQMDGLGNATTLERDAAGRLRRIVDARGNAVELRHGLNEVTVTDALGRSTTFRSTPHGLPKETLRPDGTIHRTEYLLTSDLDDADQFPTLDVDFGGRERRRTYTPYGNLATVSDLGGAIYDLEWDERLSNLKTFRDPWGRSWKWGYDAASRLESITFPDGETLRREYDEKGRIARRIQPSGASVALTYDDARRLIGQAPSTGEPVSWTWNIDDTLASTTDATGTTTYTHDAAGDLEAIDLPSGAHVGYTRDVLGRIRSIAIRPTAQAEERAGFYDFDEVGNLRQVTDPFGGATIYAHDAVNRIETRTLPNGVVTTYTYDIHDQILRLEHRDASGEILLSRTYERLPMGEPQRITRQDGSYVELSYDAGFRLERESHHAADGGLEKEIVYTYDIAGGRTAVVRDGETETYRYGVGHRLVAIHRGEEEIVRDVYDRDGRVVERTRDGRRMHLRYDVMDQLVEARDASDGSLLAIHTYDAEGRRTRVETEASSREIITAPALGGLEWTHAVIDSTNDELLAGYVLSPDGPLLRYDASGEKLYYLSDAVGTVIGLANEAGELVEEFRYSSFGEALGNGKASLPSWGDYRYHAHWLDASTDLYHARARYYDPSTGRFLSRDPAGVDIERPETFDEDAFAFSNPWMYRDPTGTTPTVMGLTASMGIQDVLGAIRTASAQYARERAKDEIGEAVGNFLLDFFSWHLPFMAESLTAVTNLYRQGGGKEGDLFELVSWQLMCSILNENFPAALNAIWLEVAVEADGKATDDGVRDCSSVFSLKKPQGSTVRPDYIFSPEAPSGNHRSTFLIGDLKRSLKNVFDKKNQTIAIFNHARNYGFHLVVYISLKSGSPRDAAWAKELALRNPRPIKVAFVSLRG